MAQDFDPYYKWLGIPPAEQPPDHYRLLGIRRLEDDPDVISNAADQRMALVRSFQSGRYSEISQKILNELSKARVCLLNPEKKAAYDAELRRSRPAEPRKLKRATVLPLEEEPAKAAPVPAAGKTPAGADADLGSLFEHVEHDHDHRPGHAPSHSHVGKKKHGLPPWILATVGGAMALVIIVGLLAAMATRDRDSHSGAGSGTETTRGSGQPEGPPPPPPGPGGIPSDMGRLVLLWPAQQHASAELSIDGERRATAGGAGSADSHLELDLAPGEHTVRIERQGFEPYETEVALVAGQPLRVAPTWQEKLPPDDGRGLVGEYFNGRACEQKILTRIDPKVHFIWDFGSPDERVPKDGFSARWTGFIKAPTAGRYKLRAEVDDGVTVWLDEEAVLFTTVGENPHPEAEVTLTGKPQALKVEYYEGRSQAAMCLTWVPPGDYLEQTIPPGALFHKEDVAEKTAVDASILRPAPADPPSSLAVGEPLDLLRYINPDAFGVQGNWWFDGDALVTGYASPGLIPIPVDLPPEYVLTAVAQRCDEDETLVTRAGSAGHPFYVGLDSHPQNGGLSGVGLIDGQGYPTNETRHAGRIFTNGQPRTITYSVRKDRLVVQADSEMIVDWAADYSRCSLPDAFAHPARPPLAIATHRSRYRISKLELTPLSEPGGLGPGHGPRPPVGPLAAVPDEEFQKQVLAKLHETLREEYRRDEPYAQLALAAKLVHLAREGNDPPELRYVMLTEANGLAARNGDSALVMVAVDELSRGFKVDSLKLAVESLGQAARQARTPSDLQMLAASATEVARNVISSATYDALVSMLHDLEQTALRVAGPDASKTVQNERKKVLRMRDLTKAWSAAQLRLAEFQDDPQACLDTGVYLCLNKADWEKGLPYLAKGADEDLAGPAAELVENADDTAAQLALADAWWALAEKSRDDGAKLLDVAAARHWYEKAVPRLTGEDLARAQERLATDEELPNRPCLLNVNGLAGVRFLAPKKVSGQVNTRQGFAALQGKCSLSYDRLPVSSYIQEFEIQFAAPSGSLSMGYGESHETSKIDFWWDGDKKKFICRVYHARGGLVVWWGEKTYDAGVPLKFTFYVNEADHRLYLDGSSQLGAGPPRPMDLQFRMSTGDKTALLVSRCEFRPWTEADAATLRCNMPPVTVDCDWKETAVRLYERNLDLDDRPDLKDPGPFVVPATATPMEWVPGGSFRRDWGDDGNSSTTIEITRGFWIGRAEINRLEWTKVAGKAIGIWRVAGSPFLPVDGVSWEQAGQFCQALQQAEQRAGRVPSGYTYRLPTEAEWEYACRAGSETDFSVDPAGFWSSETSGWQPHEVAQGDANAWNLYDMHGNVSEWCLDAWSDPPETPPARVENPFKLPEDTKGDFVLRGGAWWQGRKGCTSASRERSRNEPGGHRGFRIVLAPRVP